MTSTKPTLDYFGPYDKLFRSHVYQLIAWGYKDALVRIQSANNKEQQETAITGFIVEAVKKRLRMADRPRWLRYFSIYDDPPIETEDRSGRQRLRVDINDRRFHQRFGCTQPKKCHYRSLFGKPHTRTGLRHSLCWR